MDENELNENGDGLNEGVLRFESLDTGDAVLVYAHPTDDGQVSLFISHEMDGDLELLIDPRTVEELALRLARAADAARQGEEE
ncbi:MAG: hypothetical protein WBQ14_09270 [Gaiellaceae bacterium]